MYKAVDPILRLESNKYYFSLQWASLSNNFHNDRKTCLVLPTSTLNYLKSNVLKPLSPKENKITTKYPPFYFQQEKNT